MNIQCPNCNKVYNIDDKKIPDAGTYVKCKCDTKFFIKKDSEKAEEEPKIQAWVPAKKAHDSAQSSVTR